MTTSPSLVITAHEYHESIDFWYQFLTPIETRSRIQLPEVCSIHEEEQLFVISHCLARRYVSTSWHSHHLA